MSVSGIWQGVGFLVSGQASCELLGLKEGAGFWWRRRAAIVVGKTRKTVKP